MPPRLGAAEPGFLLRPGAAPDGAGPTLQSLPPPPLRPSAGPRLAGRACWASGTHSRRCSMPTRQSPLLGACTPGLRLRAVAMWGVWLACCMLHRWPCDASTGRRQGVPPCCTPPPAVRPAYVSQFLCARFSGKGMLPTYAQSLPPAPQARQSSSAVQLHNPEAKTERTHRCMQLFRQCRLTSGPDHPPVRSMQEQRAPHTDFITIINHDAQAVACGRPGRPWSAPDHSHGCLCARKAGAGDRI